MGDVQKEIVTQQIDRFYNQAQFFQESGDIISQLLSLTVVGNSLDLLNKANIKQVTINGESKSTQTFGNEISSKIVGLKQNIAERYVKEGDSGSCDSFAAVEFIEGSADCKWWFDTLVGLQKEKSEIKNGLIHPLQFPKLYGKLTKGILLYGSGGVGKCLDPETPVVMFDGTLSKAREIVVGDVLMGDDSTPRFVLSTTSGSDEMFKIKPEFGEEFIVNRPHILTLRSIQKPNFFFTPSDNVGVKWFQDGRLKTQMFGRILDENISEANEFMKTLKPDIIDISVDQYLKTSQEWRKYYSGYRVPVDFNQTEITPLDPYLLGTWLCTETINTEILEHYDDDLLSSLKCLGIWNDKSIPLSYKTSSRKTRMMLLAGLLDIGGFYAKERGLLCLGLSLKSKVLSDDVIFLARSLGFFVFQRGQEILLTGSFIKEIPCRIMDKRQNVKHTDRFNFTLESQGLGEYCGFTLSGNGRFLLGDFTVTHNTAIVKAAINEMSYESSGNIKVLFYAPSIGQLKGKYFGDSEKMISSMFECASGDACKLQKTMTDSEVVSVIFLDEFDSIAGNRSDDKFMATTVNALLQVMDGIKTYPNVTLIAATNLPWNLDSAILRRFTTSIFVELPKPDDIYNLFSNQITQQIDSVLSLKEQDHLSIFCDSIEKRKSSKRTTTRSSKPCQRRPAVVEIWSRPPFNTIMRHIDPLKLRTLATLCSQELYSNSDIDRLFKNVVQRVADQAVATNTFVTYSDLGGSQRHISTSSFYPQDLYKIYNQPKGKKKFYFIGAPKHLSATIGEETMINQSLNPFFNIADPNILEVFVGNIVYNPKNQTISSYEYLLSFVTVLQQDEPANYSVDQQKHDQQYKIITEILERNNYSTESLGDLPYYELERILGKELMESLETLIIPGLQRKEYYFMKGKIDTSKGVLSSTTTFLSQGWRYLTGTITDWSKIAQNEKEEYIQSLSVLKTLSSYSKQIITPWFAKKNNVKSIDLNGQDIAVKLNQRLYKTKQSIFSLSAIDIFAENDTYNEFIEELSGYGQNIKINNLPFKLANFDLIKYFFLGSINLYLLS